MSGPSEREIARRLRETDGLDAAPPPDLLRRLTADLPPSVAVHPAVIAETRPAKPPVWRSWLIAASLVATLGGGLVALRVMQRMTAPPETVAAHPAPARGEAAKRAPLGAEVPGSVVPRAGLEESGPAVPSPEGVRGDAAEARPSVPPATRAAEPLAVRASPPAMEPQPRPAPSAPVASAPPAPAPALRRDARDEVAERQDAVPAGAAGAPHEPERSRTEASYATAPAAAPEMATAAAPRAKSSAAPAPARPNAAAEGSAGGAIPGGVGSLSASGGESRLADRFSRQQSAALGSALPLSAEAVSSGIYAAVRSLLRGGQLPPPPLIHTEDFVRAFTLAEKSEVPGLALAAEGAPSPFESGDRERLLLLRLVVGDEERGRAPSVAEARVVFDRSLVAGHRLLGVTGNPSGSLSALRAGDHVAALYEIELQPGVRATAAPRRLATVELRFGNEPGRAAERSLPVPVSAFVAFWSQASPGFRLSALAAQLADVLAGSRPASRLPALLARARELTPALQGTPRAAKLDELIELIGWAARLMGKER